MSRRLRIDRLFETLESLNYNDKNGKGSMIGLYEAPPLYFAPVDLALRTIVEIVNANKTTE
ncbi:MAG: hypothetical protein ACTSRU_07425 [Candidatus Hodarchaeales archaeon]